MSREACSNDADMSATFDARDTDPDAAATVREGVGQTSIGRSWIVVIGSVPAIDGVGSRPVSSGYVFIRV